MVVSSEWMGEDPGLRSVEMAIGTLAWRRAPTGGCCFSFRVIESAGKQHGDGAGFGDGLNPILIEIFDVIDRKRAERGGHLGAAEVGELLGVELDGQVVAAGGGEDAGGLLDAESNLLAEGIDGIGELLVGDGGEGLIADEFQVAVAVVLEFRRQGVGAEKAGDDIDRAELSQFAGDAQHFHFSVDVEAVT